MVFRVHPAPPQLVSLSCAWPLSRRSERVGEAILEGMFIKYFNLCSVYVQSMFSLCSV
jgi:hypothetical protein